MSQIILHHYAGPATRSHLWIGMLMTFVAIVFGIEQGSAWLASHPMASHGLQASLLAGLATGLGAIPVLFMRRPGERLLAPMLGLAGGMMLAASFFSLLVPAVQSIGNSSVPWVLGILTGVAFLAGSQMMQQMDRQLPHIHVESLEADSRAPNVTLVVAAIALHNLPEGLAVGVAAASGADHGITLGIALQNIPEGWIVASAMIVLGASPLRAVAIALGTGLVEPVGGMIGVVASSLAGNALPLALAAAAGAMLWVVSHELIPASHKPGQETAGTAGLACGFAIMTALAVVL